MPPPPAAGVMALCRAARARLSAQEVAWRSKALFFECQCARGADSSRASHCPLGVVINDARFAEPRGPRMMSSVAGAVSRFL